VRTKLILLDSLLQENGFRIREATSSSKAGEKTTF